MLPRTSPLPHHLDPAIPLGCDAVQSRVREMIDEDEAAEDGEEGVEGEVAPRMGGRRPLTHRELEEVTIQACLVPVGGVPSVDQVCPWRDGDY